jgi:3-isopropylmalate dehydrogenase
VPVGLVERKLLLELRFGLDQYVNLRPIKLYPGVWTPIKDKGPEEIDFVVIRENTEDMYVGTGGFAHYGTPDEVATQVAVYTRKGTERIIRYAFELARARNKAMVTTYGSGPSRRWGRSTRTSRRTGPMWTRPACGW